MKIMKFGGSSLGTGKRMLHVAEIIGNYSKKEHVIVVASAMYQITDKLISIFQSYKSKLFENAFDEIKHVFAMHKQALDELELPKEKKKQLNKKLLKLFGDLHIHLTLSDHYSPIDYDYCISFGERLSSYLLEAALQNQGVPAKVVDASKIIIANDKFGNAKALIRYTRKQAKKLLTPLLSQNKVPVIGGFFASTIDGKIITLGRGGSDYSATVLAHALDASEVILWKEVDGVFSCDPKKDSQAKFYPELSYEAALSLAQKGAKILHPEAMKPVASKGIIVRVKNTFNPDFRGTKIWKGTTI